MYAVGRNQIAVLLLLLTTLAVASTGCKRTPRRDASARLAVASAAAVPPPAAVQPVPSLQPAPTLAPPEPTPPPMAPPPPPPQPTLVVPKALVRPPRLAPKALPPDDLMPLRKLESPPDEPEVMGGVADGVPGGVIGGTVPAVDPMDRDDRLRALPRPAPDNATPAWPADADPGITDARVTLRVSVDLDGSVSAVQVTSGAAPFTTAAVAAARAWRFTPATVGGSPIAMTINMVVAFRR